MGKDTLRFSRFKFVNNLDRDLYAAVHHVGCAGLPWRGGHAMCWSEDIKKKSNAVYEPSVWVTEFETWADIIGAGIGAGIAIAVTAGAAAPAAAVAVAEVAGAVELSELAATSVELTTVEATSMTSRVMAILGAAAVGVVTGEVLRRIMEGWGAYVRPQNWADDLEPRKLYLHKGEVIICVPDLKTAEDPKYFAKA